MPAELEDVPLRYLLGVLAMPFTPLWEAGKQVLLIHANAHHAMYWATMWEYVLHTSKALTSVQEDEIRTKQQAVATEGSDDRRCFAALMAVAVGGLTAYMIAVLFIVPLILALAVSRSAVIVVFVLLIAGSVAGARYFGFI